MEFMKSPAIFCLILVSVLFTTSYGYRFGRLVGGRTEIPNVKANSEVQELGRFSVEEYNRSLRLWRPTAVVYDGAAGDDQPLEFRQVVEAERQVVSGIKYYLKISTTTQNGMHRMFDSVVLVKPWLQSKQLLNFAPSFQQK